MLSHHACYANLSFRPPVFLAMGMAPYLIDIICRKDISLIGNSLNEKSVGGGGINSNTLIRFQQKELGHSRGHERSKIT